MRGARAFEALGPVDARNVARDPLLRWMLVLPLFFALLFRVVAGLATDWLAGYGIALEAYHPLIASFIVLIAPMICGVVVGFLLLDQKDDGTLHALRVTPLTPGAWLAYRLAGPMALSVLLTPIMLTASGLSDVGLGGQLLAGVVAAPLAPAFTLFLAAFARNKVQGFALMKASGVVNWPPILAWFVDGPWHGVFGLVPTYWPARLYWSLEGSPQPASPGDVAIQALVGLVYPAVLTVLFYRRFNRTLQRG